jgi:type I site-specific restriction endonuclease
MNEEETKLNLITPMLQKVGWGSVESSVIRMEYPISKGRLIGGGRRTRPDSADYVLQYKGQNLAIIEAKALGKYYTEGVAQTKSYATRLQVRFCYASNGKETYAIDNHTGRESDVFNYPSPDELWQMTYATSNRWRDRFASIPFEDRGGLWEMRYYQANAVNNVLNAVANNSKRILLTLATGTRLFKGKDYFTIIDFVKAHTKFQDKDWDGEQVEIEQNVYKKLNSKPCEICGFNPCKCEKTPPEIVEIKLRDGTSRIVHTIKTTFYNADGNQVDVKEFLTTLFGKLPDFFRNEEQLREVWADPNTRDNLLNQLKNIGYGIQELKDLQHIVRAENSDIFDVLSFIAFDKQPISRIERIKNTYFYINKITKQQQEFISFVLTQYQNKGFEELSLNNLPQLLEVKYNTISDANIVLGSLDNIKHTFVELQHHLYNKKVS